MSASFGVCDTFFTICDMIFTFYNEIFTFCTKVYLYLRHLLLTYDTISVFCDQPHSIFYTTHPFLSFIAIYTVYRYSYLCNLTWCIFRKSWSVLKSGRYRSLTTTQLIFVQNVRHRHCSYTLLANTTVFQNICGAEEANRIFSFCIPSNPLFGCSLVNSATDSWTEPAPMDVEMMAKWPPSELIEGSEAAKRTKIAPPASIQF